VVSKAGTPFKRAFALMRAIQALLATGVNPQAALAGMAPYKSRGKGGKHHTMCRTNFRGTGKTYRPNGDREVARRLRQMGRAAA